ncbi:MAG: T9SS type A sorting domain-containing protein, partial [Saprospiraceae bacterium]
AACFSICFYLWECGDDNADSDNDGTPDFCDEEECDDLDNDGDGEIDEDGVCPPDDCDASELTDCEIDIVWTCTSVKICLGKDISNVVVDLGIPGFQNSDFKDETIDEQTWTYTAPAGEVINGVWVKTADFCGKCTDDPQNLGYQGAGGAACPSGNGGGPYHDNPNVCSAAQENAVLLRNNTPYRQTVILPESAQSLRVFPNPAVNELSVDLTAFRGKAVKLQIFNSVGQLQRFIEIDEVATDLTLIDIRTLTGDLYFLKVQVADETMLTQKFVVKR